MASSDEIETSPAAERDGRKPVVWGLATAFLAAGLALVFLGEGGAPPLSRGDSAPSFALPRWPDQGRLELEQLQDRVVLVNFWATWCKPCKDEMPAMERLYRELAPEGFELLAISVDENPGDIGQFLQQVEVSFPVLLDPKQTVSRQYQTMGFPESFLVDREGLIVERYIGPRDWDHPDHLARIRRLMTE